MAQVAPAAAGGRDHPDRQGPDLTPAQILDERRGGHRVGHPGCEDPARSPGLGVGLEPKTSEVAAPPMAGSGYGMLGQRSFAAPAAGAAETPGCDHMMSHQQGPAAARGLDVVVSLPGRTRGVVPIAPAQVGGVVDQPGIGKLGSQQIGGVGERRVVAGLGTADGPALDPLSRSGASSARIAVGVVDIGGIHIQTVREEGLEPSRPCGHRNLNPARLPNSATRAWHRRFRAGGLVEASAFAGRITPSGLAG